MILSLSGQTKMIFIYLSSVGGRDITGYAHKFLEVNQNENTKCTYFVTVM